MEDFSWSGRRAYRVFPVDLFNHPVLSLSKKAEFVWWSYVEFLTQLKGINADRELAVQWEEEVILSSKQSVFTPQSQSAEKVIFDKKDIYFRNSYSLLCGMSNFSITSPLSNNYMWILHQSHTLIGMRDHFKSQQKRT